MEVSFGFCRNNFVSCELLDRLSWKTEAEITISLSDVVAALKEINEDEDEKGEE